MPSTLPLPPDAMYLLLLLLVCLLPTITTGQQGKMTDNLSTGQVDVRNTMAKTMAKHILTILFNTRGNIECMASLVKLFQRNAKNAEIAGRVQAAEQDRKWRQEEQAQASARRFGHTPWRRRFARTD